MGRRPEPGAVEPVRCAARRLGDDATTRSGIGSPWWALLNPGFTATPTTLPSVTPSARATGADIATGIASPAENAPGSSPDTIVTPERFAGVNMAAWSRKSAVVVTPAMVAMFVIGPMTVVVVPAETRLIHGREAVRDRLSEIRNTGRFKRCAAGPRRCARVDSPTGTLMTGSARDPAVATACRAPRSTVSATCWGAATASTATKATSSPTRPTTPRRDGPCEESASARRQ